MTPEKQTEGRRILDSEPETTLAQLASRLGVPQSDAYRTFAADFRGRKRGPKGSGSTEIDFTVPPVAAASITDAAAAFAAALANAGTLNEPAVRALVAEITAPLSARVDALSVRPVYSITLSESGTAVELPDELYHEQFPQMLQTLRALGILWLCGPAGSGKTHSAGQLAVAMSKALDRPMPYLAISCSGGLSESTFTGRRLLDGSYLTPEFLNVYENGGVVLWDEIDRADPNAMIVINAALSNGHLSTPQRPGSAMATRHKDFYAIFATNTWGNGPDGQYLAAEGMDAATRDRAACAKFEIGYSDAIETAILGSKKSLLAKFRDVRAKAAEHKLRRVVSTRAMEQAARLAAAGMDDLTILAQFARDWSAPERAKVGL